MCQGLEALLPPSKKAKHGNQATAKLAERVLRQERSYGRAVVAGARRDGGSLPRVVTLIRRSDNVWA